MTDATQSNRRPGGKLGCTSRSYRLTDKARAYLDGQNDVLRAVAEQAEAEFERQRKLWGNDGGAGEEDE